LCDAVRLSAWVIKHQIGLEDSAFSDNHFVYDEFSVPPLDGQFATERQHGELVNAVIKFLAVAAVTALAACGGAADLPSSVPSKGTNSGESAATNVVVLMRCRLDATPSFKKAWHSDYMFQSFKYNAGLQKVYENDDKAIDAKITSADISWVTVRDPRGEGFTTRVMEKATGDLREFFTNARGEAKQSSGVGVCAEEKSARWAALANEADASRAAATVTGPYVTQGALACISLASFSRGLVVRQWNNAPLPGDCEVTTDEQTSVTNVRRLPYPYAVLATVTSTGQTGLFEADHVHEAAEVVNSTAPSTQSDSSGAVSAATTEVPYNASRLDVPAGTAGARAGQTPQAAADASLSSVDTGGETVRAFYSALAQANGAKANSFMTVEKRAAPAYQPDAIDTFYGHMAEPLTLLSLNASGSGEYDVRYRYRKQTAVCNGHAIVTTQQTEGRVLIAKIRPLGNC
jgi:hypothetical protein